MSRAEVSGAEVSGSVAAPTPAGNRTAAPYPDRMCVHELIEAQTRLTPDSVAVEFHRQKLTYAELDDRATRFANYLHRLDVKPQSLIGVCLERSLEPLVTFLAVMKAGCAYLPLDPGLPAERLAYMLEDSGAAILVTSRSLLPRFAACRAVIVTLEDSLSAVAAEPAERRQTGVQPDDLVYVIYTSGSTGQPKGVMIRHRSVVNLLHSMRREPGLGADEALLAITTVSFDISVLELFLPLTVGGRVIIAGRDAVTDARKLAAELALRRPALMQATPATWRMLIDGGWTGDQSLKALCGGESLSRDLAEELLKRVGSLWNMYGPTETTVWSLIAPVHPGSGAVPIGRPIANTTVYILDALGQPVPSGAPGRLYIGGEGLAPGYKNRPQLTSQMFVANPLPGHAGERIYDTGDLASYRADGNIEWLGRVDRQIKIHGHRIEPEEIESVLMRHTGVTGAVVAVHARPGDDKRLIAYILPAGPVAPSSSEMRSHCETFLPAYMVPAAFLSVDAFPMTPNGKVDRNALPEPDRALRRGSLPELSERKTIAPRTALESTLLRIFEQILLAYPVCVTDDFFASGGTSLLAAQLVLSIEKQTGHRLPVAALFQASTVRQLAQTLENRSYLTAWSPLVELRRGDSGSDPLFCIHWLDAKLVTFHKIASLLREDRTVYGLQPRSPDGTAEPPHSIREMAAVYLREIRLCRPRGPYHLAGSCLGGVVAFEIAQQLIAAGEQVELLVLIDAFMPGPLQYLHRRPYLVEQIDRYAGEFLLSPFAALKRWLRESAIRMTVRVRGNSPSARPAHNLRQITRRAEAEYRPRPYSGKITLLICSDASCRAYEDRRLAWSSVADGGFEVYTVPGNHSTMEQEPNIQAIGEQLQRCFDRLARRPSAFSSTAR